MFHVLNTVGSSGSVASSSDSSVRLIGLHVKPIGSRGNDRSVEVNMTRRKANIQEQSVVTSHCFAINLAGPGWSMANGSEVCVCRWGGRLETDRARRQREKKGGINHTRASYWQVCVDMEGSEQQRLALTGLFNHTHIQGNASIYTHTHKFTHTNLCFQTNWLNECTPQSLTSHLSSEWSWNCIELSKKY